MQFETLIFVVNPEIGVTKSVFIVFVTHLPTALSRFLGLEKKEHTALRTEKMVC